MNNFSCFGAYFWCGIDEKHIMKYSIFVIKQIHTVRRYIEATVTDLTFLNGLFSRTLDKKTCGFCRFFVTSKKS